MPAACRPSGRHVHRRVTPCGAVRRRVRHAPCAGRRVHRRAAPCGAVWRRVRHVPCAGRRVHRRAAPCDKSAVRAAVRPAV
eukprot:gene11870-biopygen5029